MNTLGLHRIMFAVDDIDVVVARLLAHGAELVGEMVQYENTYRLAYVRGPEGIIIALAEHKMLPHGRRYNGTGLAAGETLVGALGLAVRRRSRRRVFVLDFRSGCFRTTALAARLAR